MVPVMAYDPACKLLFTHPRMAEDLLHGLVAGRWSHALDFGTLELRSAASVSDDLRRRRGDLLSRVRLGAAWLYVQLEFQSTVDPTMAGRLRRALEPSTFGRQRNRHSRARSPGVRPVRTSSTIRRRYPGAYAARLSVIRTPPSHNGQVSTKAGQLQSGW